MRFRKGKKAWKQSYRPKKTIQEGTPQYGEPLWIWGPHATGKRLRNAKRYHMFLLVMEWKKECALAGIRAALIGMSGALQLASVAGAPRPKFVTPEEYAKTKAEKIIDISRFTAIALGSIEVPPKPRLVFMSNPDVGDNWAKDAFLSCDMGILKQDHSQVNQWFLDGGVLMRVDKPNILPLTDQS